MAEPDSYTRLWIQQGWTDAKLLLKHRVFVTIELIVCGGITVLFLFFFGSSSAVLDGVIAIIAGIISSLMLASICVAFSFLLALFKIDLMRQAQIASLREELLWVTADRDRYRAELALNAKLEIIFDEDDPRCSQKLDDRTGIFRVLVRHDKRGVKLEGIEVKLLKLTALNGDAAHQKSANDLVPCRLMQRHDRMRPIPAPCFDLTDGDEKEIDVIEGRKGDDVFAICHAIKLHDGLDNHGHFIRDPTDKVPATNWKLKIVARGPEADPCEREFIVYHDENAPIGNLRFTPLSANQD